MSIIQLFRQAQICLEAADFTLTQEFLIKARLRWQTFRPQFKTMYKDYYEQASLLLALLLIRDSIWTDAVDIIEELLSNSPENTEAIDLRDNIKAGIKTDKNGFNKLHINIKTGTHYGPEGYDYQGYNINGYNSQGYNKDGFNVQGYDTEGYDEFGYNKDGLDKGGFNSRGNHYQTRSMYNKDGFDKDGYDSDGYNKFGLNREGYTREGKNIRPADHSWMKTPIDPLVADNWRDV